MEIGIVYQPEQVESRVVVGHGDDDHVLSTLITMLSSYGRLYVFIDRNLRQNSPLVSSIMEKLQVAGALSYDVEASESNKTMDTVLQMCAWLMENGADRKATLVAIGGGITTDMVGFAASIYKRGVRYISVPTTLLSQVDAGLGGKTGVNFQQYKNMLGVVHQPAVSYIWPAFLRTLPRRDFLSGAAEMLKTFIIEDNGSWYERAVRLLTGYSEAEDSKLFLAENNMELSQIVEAAASVKAGVVSRDPFEKGERRKLNLGHTFAHSMETLAQREGRDLAHGEAVSMGLVMAARLAERLSSVEKGLEEKVSKDLKEIGLPTECPYSINQMADAMGKDKKADGGKVHFVIPTRIGNVETKSLTVKEVCALMA